MRWVLMTPLGWPVEPEVNRILATVSGPTLAKAASTAGVGRTSASAETGVTGATPPRLPRLAAISTPAGTPSVASALA